MPKQFFNFLWFRIDNFFRKSVDSWLGCIDKWNGRELDVTLLSEEGFQ